MQKKNRIYSSRGSERGSMTQSEFEASVAKIQQGDKEGLREIYEAYISYIYMIVLGIVGSRENAEDVTSEFFIKIWTVLDTYQNNGAHKAWLATIARNMALDFLRKNKREIPAEEFAEEVSSDETPEEEVVGELSVQEALATLNEAERQVVDMKVLGEMSFREISESLNVPMGTVTWRYQNAIKKLRRCGYE